MLSDPFSLSGKKIVITGASSGIGRACASVCASLGAELFLVGRDETRLKTTIAELKETGNHFFCTADLQDPSVIKSVVSELALSRGPIAGFIHSAGIEMTTPLSFLQKEQFDEIFSVNFMAGVEMAKAFSRKGSFSQSGASFVFVSSILSLRPKANTLFYAASKAAINAAMRTLAVELAPKKIRVNSVLPSVVKTELIQAAFDNLPEETVKKRLQEHLLGFGEPQDIAYACSYLLSDAAKWITGTELIVDGGHSCI